MNTTTLQENKMGVMPIGRLIANMALPMIISMLVQALYNVVDSVYVSQVSESAVTALSLAFPIQNLLIGFAVGIGVGVNSLLSKSLGEKNQEAANRAAGNGMVLIAIAIAVFVLFGLFGVGPYYSMQSENPATVEGGIAYTRICCVFSMGCFVSILGERLLQSTGRTVHTMITQSTGAIINIILDPILIHGGFGLPAMGIAGAAVATVIGQWASGIMVLVFNLKYNPEVQFGRQYFRLEGKTVGAILTVGVPSIVMNGIGSVMSFGINQILQGFAETATGVFGVYFKLQSFFFMPLFGLNNATISIIAYNYGARRPQRITKTLKISCTAALSLMAAGLLVFQFFPDLLLGLFNPSQAFLEIGRSALRTISWSFLIAAVCIALGASFQALGNGIYSTIVSLCRQLIVLLPAAYLLSLSGDVHKVWLAFPIAEVASGAVTLVCFSRIYRQKIRPMFDVRR
ncbi:MAG: MATE family efflux transporter [Faecousia sp.]